MSLKLTWAAIPTLRLAKVLGLVTSLLSILVALLSALLLGFVLTGFLECKSTALTNPRVLKLDPTALGDVMPDGELARKLSVRRLIEWNRAVSCPRVAA